ncbi:MAG: hypothetical protein SNJ69_13320 [Chloroflexaceae bacterium]
MGGLYFTNQPAACRPILTIRRRRPTPSPPVPSFLVGIDIFWGYAASVVTTRLPGHTAMVLAECTRPFKESDSSYVQPLMAQVEARLGRRPRFSTWNAADDAHDAYES